ncbi:MAG: amidohydrolase family protein [Treponema sp.]|jgi:N-acyl-D-aspartate/D-glutamate deacylase|nr:amidohydrolase family protein [Treponema sp.]
MFDLLIKNARVIDGSGKPGFTGDIGVRDGRIEVLAPRVGGEAGRTIELNGELAAPGFIDIHRHADAAVFRPGFGEAELRQGITSIINGNCGLSIAPLPSARRAGILDFLAPVTGTLPEEDAGGRPLRFESFSEYASLLKTTALPLNAGILAGSGTIRAAAMGYGGGIPGEEELSRIRAFLEDALASGVPGVSVGFSYLPDSYYNAAGLARALAPLSGRGRPSSRAGEGPPLVCHLRGEGDLLYPSAAEAIEAARLLRTPLRISHFKCIGRKNWGAGLEKVIALIERNREEGMRIDCDAYPWTAGSTQLLSVLPPSFLAGGIGETLRRLQDPEERAGCRRALAEPGRDFENVVLGLGWEAIYVTGLESEGNRPLIGKNLAEIAALRGSDPFDAAFDLLAEERCNVTMVDYITCQEAIDRIIRLPYTSIISDSLYSGRGLPHPRSNTNTSMVFHELVCRRKLLSPEEAVHKLTGLPAEAMGLPGKGLLKPGFDADIVIFRPENISAPADYVSPDRFTAGFDYVFVAGRLVLEKGRLSGLRPGRYIGLRVRGLPFILRLSLPRQQSSDIVPRRPEQGGQGFADKFPGGFVNIVESMYHTAGVFEPA